MEEVLLTHAEVVTFSKKSDEVIREKKTDKGIGLNFNVRTKINDRISNCPHLYRMCSFWVNDVSSIDSIKSKLAKGSIIDIRGKTSNYKGSDGKYHDFVKVDTFVPIATIKDQAADVATAQEDSSACLPF